MSTDQVLQLQEPFTDGGIRAVNFFNGRLLTGKDLSREQEARREAARRLGLALGEGVAFGLDVEEDTALSTASAPVLRVKAGLALNRYGQTLRLGADANLSLTRRFDPLASDCLFTDCTPIAGGSYIAGAGVYVLALAPAESSEGRAATNSLDPAGLRCNTDAIVEAVQFRLIAVPSKHYADLDPASKQFRNRLAYRCFGIEEREKALADLWRQNPDAYGLIATLRREGLDARDVPLAILYWTAGGVQFIDMWAVRRRLLWPDAPADRAVTQNGRSLVEAEAMCAQFRGQTEQLLASAANPASVVAREHFRYLPPFGLVPLHTPQFRGFNDSVFFSGLIRRTSPGSGQGPVFVDARMLGVMRRQALTGSVVDTSRGELIWVYRPWQNVEAGRGGQTVQPIVVFTSGLMPYFAAPRLDLARLDYSNYARCCDK